MLEKLSLFLYKRLIANKVKIVHNNFQEYINQIEDPLVISSPSAWNAFDSLYSISSNSILLNQSLQVNAIRKTAESANYPVIIGIGGGKIMDCTKAIAKKTKSRSVLIPTILSTTAWLNPSSSLKDGEIVEHAKGKINEILIQPELISSSPQGLTISGIADLLCGFNSLSDWILAHEIEGVRFPKRAKYIILKYCSKIMNDLEKNMPVSANNISFYTKAFIEGLENCWNLLSGRPLEGSEHFLYYALEEKLNRPMLHGSVIAFTTLLCLKLRQEDSIINPSELKAFFDRCGIDYQLSSLNISPSLMEGILKEMGVFVKKRKLPFSIWNLEGLFENIDCGELFEWLEKK